MDNQMIYVFAFTLVYFIRDAVAVNYDCIVPKFERLGDSCITGATFNGRAPFYEAEQTCNTWKYPDGTKTNGYLPKFNTEAEWNNFKKQLEERQIDAVWIWARYDHRSINDKGYKWGDRTAISWSVPWINGVEPTAPSEEYQLCVWADRASNYMWKVKQCDNDESPFICMMPQDEVVATTPEPTSTTSTTTAVQSTTTIVTTTEPTGCAAPNVNTRVVDKLTTWRAHKAGLYSIGAQFVHQCADGYHFRENDTRHVYTCTESGNWNDYQPQEDVCRTINNRTNAVETPPPTSLPDKTEAPRKEGKMNAIDFNFDNKPFEPEELSDTGRAMATAVQSMGCVFLIASLTSILVLYILFRSLGTESVIVFNQDLALLLAYIIVLGLREPGMYTNGMSSWLCHIAAVAMHFFFLAGYMFMFLEALQTMIITGNVIAKGALFSRSVNVAIGWGVPLIIVGVSSQLIGDEYTTKWSCWGDMRHGLVWGLLFPMAIICAVAVVMVEAGGMLNRLNAPFPDHDPVQRASVLVSRSSLMIVMLLTVGSHVIGMAAVYYQLIPLYGACFIMNIVNAIAVFFFHTSMDTNIRTAVANTFKVLCGQSVKKA